MQYIYQVPYEEKQIILWATDYGFPFESHAKYMKKLDKQFVIKLNLIQKGGLNNIVPAENVCFDKILSVFFVFNFVFLF